MKSELFISWNPKFAIFLSHFIVAASSHLICFLSFAILPQYPCHSLIFSNTMASNHVAIIQDVDGRNFSPYALFILFFFSLLTFYWLPCHLLSSTMPTIVSKNNHQPRHLFHLCMVIPVSPLLPAISGSHTPSPTLTPPCLDHCVQK